MKRFNKNFLNGMKREKLEEGKGKGYHMRDEEAFWGAVSHFRDECYEAIGKLYMKKGISENSPSWNGILWELADVSNMVDLLFSWILDNKSIPMSAK